MSDPRDSEERVVLVHILDADEATADVVHQKLSTTVPHGSWVTKPSTTFDLIEARWTSPEGSESVWLFYKDDIVMMHPAVLLTRSRDLAVTPQIIAFRARDLVKNATELLELTQCCGPTRPALRDYWRAAISSYLNYVQGTLK